MKTKHLLLGISVLVGLGALWFGRAAWRAHRQLVTLHVRNMPLAEVLRKIERQTWEKIRAERNVDTRITLNVTDKPLSDVLDRLAEQAGARWVTLYAVYGSRPALKNLDSALRADGKIEDAGWKKVAPPVAELKPPRQHSLGEEAGNGPEPETVDLSSLPPGAAVMTATADVDIRGAPGTNPAAQGPKYRTAARPGPQQPPARYDDRNSEQSTLSPPLRAGTARGPMVIRIARKGGQDSSGAVEQEVWTPEELVVESGISARLGGDDAQSATPEAAAQVARKVGGKWTTYLALRKSPLGMGFMGAFQPKRMARLIGAPGQQGTNFNSPEIGPDLEDPITRQRNAEFGRLTPQQRVERARERQRLQQK